MALEEGAVAVEPMAEPEAAEEERASKRRSSKRHSSSKRSSKKRDSSKRTSSSRKRRSKRLTKADEESDPIVSSMATAWTYGSMVTMFLVVYVVHWAVDTVLKLQHKKMNKHDRVVLMGKLFRRTSAAMVIDMNPFWSQKVTYEVAPEDLPKAFIAAANHLSFVDPWALSAALRPREAKFVGKADLWDIPVAGKALHHAGDMPVHFVKDKAKGRWRTKTGTIDRLMETARDYLDNDIPVAVFPEGTVSRKGPLLPFKLGFFQLAMDAQVPIVPVGMFGNQKAWPNVQDSKNSQGSFLLQPAEMHARVGAPIYPEDKPLEQFVDEVYYAIQELRNNLPNFDLPPEIAVVDYKSMEALPLTKADHEDEE